MFYVQYAHARTRGAARNAVAAGVEPQRLRRRRCWTTPPKTSCCSYLGSYPSIVAKAAELREPHRVARHLEVIAGAYHRWYDACRVAPMGEEAITDTNRTRLWLNDATSQVLANGLELLGVSRAGTDVSAMTAAHGSQPAGSPLAPDWLAVPADLNALHEPLWAQDVARGDGGELASRRHPGQRAQGAVRHAAVRA